MNKQIWIIFTLVIILGFSFFLYNTKEKPYETAAPTTINKNFEYLTENDDLGAEYDKVVVFEPDEKYLHEIKKNGESLKHIIPSKNIVKGRLIVENKTKEKVVTNNHFLQGDKVKSYTLQEKQNKVYSYTVTTPPHSRSETPIQIKINPDGKHELTYFPQDNTDPLDGTELSLLRYYLGDTDYIDKPLKSKKKEKEVNPKDLDRYSLLPQPELKGKRRNTIKIPPTLMDNSLEISFLDSHLKKISELDTVSVLAKKEKEIKLDSRLTNLLRNEKTIYMLYYTNEGEAIITDFLEAVDGGKPYLSSQQNVIRYVAEDT